MQRGREGKMDVFDAGDPFDAIQRLGSFGTGDPFDDPFFTRPLGTMFEPTIFDLITPKSNGGKGIVIEELNSDEEDGEAKYVGSGNEPSIEHPDESGNDGKIQSVNCRNDCDKVKGSKPQTRSFSFQTSRVTYGGVDGTYYTSTKSRKTGSDGVVIEERKEADLTTGQATNRISRGIHDKGHSVTRKLNADGKVDTTQTLHNLNEDELEDFEKAWKGNSEGHLTGWSDGFSVPAKSGSGSHEQMGLETSISRAGPKHRTSRSKP